jgi:hypothetical protein
MLEIARLSGGSDRFELGFVERESTPESAMKLGIRLHLAGLSDVSYKPYICRVAVLNLRGDESCLTFTEYGE